MSYFECFSVTIILRCSPTKSDESTFFILDVDLIFVRNWLLRYINENAKRSAESILNLFYYMEQSTANSNSFKIAQKTAFEAKGRLYTTGKVIQRLFIIDLYT